MVLLVFGVMRRRNRAQVAGASPLAGNLTNVYPSLLQELRERFEKHFAESNRGTRIGDRLLPAALRRFKSSLRTSYS